MSQRRSSIAGKGHSPPHSPSSSSKLNQSSLGRHNKTSRRQNRHTLTTSWVAAQEEQNAAATTPVQQEILTPAITLTQPKESDEAVSEVLVPGARQWRQERPSEGGARTSEMGAGLSDTGSRPSETSASKRHSASSSSLLSTSRMHHTGEQHGQLSATVLVDQPILEDDEEDEEREGEVTGADSSLLPPQSSTSPQPSPRSLWSRSRALSYPAQSHTSQRAMLQLPRPDPAAEEGEGERNEERGVEEREEENGAVSRGSSGQPQPTAMFKFVQMAVMAKKWKKRSNFEESRPSSQTSREMLSTRQKRRPLVEMPRCIKLEVLDEAYHIVHKTLQMYRSELGLRNPLTLMAEQHCENLEQQLNQHTH